MESPETLIENLSARQVVDNSPDGMLLVDAQGVVVFANPAAKSLFSQSGHFLKGSQFGVPLGGGRVQEIELLNQQEIELLNQEGGLRRAIA